MPAPAASSQPCSSCATYAHAGEGELSAHGATLCVTLNGGTRQALDRGLEDNTAGQQRSNGSASKGACVFVVCDASLRLRERTWPCMCSLSISLRLETAKVQHTGGSSPAGRRINQRQVAHSTARRAWVGTRQPYCLHPLKKSLRKSFWSKFLNFN